MDDLKTFKIKSVSTDFDRNLYYVIITYNHKDYLGVDNTFDKALQAAALEIIYKENEK